MKNYGYILVTFLFMSSFYSYGQKIETERFTYTEGVTYEFIRITKKSIFTDFNDNKYIAPKGNRYITVLVKFYNDSDNKQEIDFENIYLLDANNNKCRVLEVLMSGKLTSAAKAKSFNLRKGGSRTFIVTFSPTIPKDEEVTRFLVNEEIISIQ